MAASQLVMIFSRRPQPGQAKTRLIPALGPEGAADCQRRMTEQLLERLARFPDAAIEVHFAGDAEGMRAWLGPDVTLRPQAAGDLGQRLDAAFAEAFARGAERVLVCGADIPALSAAHCRQAFAALDHADAVLGPATDGGYYLLGLKQPAPELFRGLPWGGPEVARISRERAAAAGLSLCLLHPESDVDRPEDLRVWQAHRDLTPAPALCIVIPALNEAARLPETLASLPADAAVIVADGGSTDATAELAAAAGAIVLPAPRGRARQMNAGAALATAEHLLFLHADTRLPPDAADHIAAILADPAVAVGAFRLSFDDRHWLLRLIAAGANVRGRLLRRPYGDQGLFMRRADFQALGGFPDQPLLEDVDLLRRLRRRGRLRLAPAAVTSSARRWRRRGIVASTLRNQAIIIAHALGIAPERLARWYRH